MCASTVMMEYEYKGAPPYKKEFQCYKQKKSREVLFEKFFIDSYIFRSIDVKDSSYGEQFAFPAGSLSRFCSQVISTGADPLWRVDEVRLFLTVPFKVPAKCVCNIAM